MVTRPAAGIESREGAAACHNLAGADPGRSWLERGQSRVGLVSYAYHSFMSGCPVLGGTPVGQAALVRVQTAANGRDVLSHRNQGRYAPLRIPVTGRRQKMYIESSDSGIVMPEFQQKRLRPVGLASPVDSAGLACLLCYGVLSWVTRSSGDPPLYAFLGLAAVVAATIFGLYFYYRHHSDKPFPVARLIGWAVLFRVCGLIGGPFYEDDFYRYLWDAFRFVQDGTPYGLPPEAFFYSLEVPDQFQRILDGINYPELPTIYGPVTQLVFVAGYGISPGSVTVLQALMVLFDLMAIFLLLRLAPAPAVMLYAWNPLVVKEIAFTAHPDGIAVCLVLAAIVLSRKDRMRGAAICLALAVGAKILALLVVPFVLIRARWRAWGLFAAVLALAYLPFVLQGSTDLQTLLTFTREWEFNAAFFSLIKPWLPNHIARVLCGLILATMVAGYYWHFRKTGIGTIVRGDWLYGALLALWPVVNPWYLLWLLPFAAIRPSFWAWTASVAVLLSYITGINLNDMDLHPFAHPAWVRPVEYGLILLALVYEYWRRIRGLSAIGFRPAD